MRLINTQTLKLHQFLGSKPEYAILSHHWEDDEVTFQEMQHLTDEIQSKSGFQKIKNFCRIALSCGCRYAWVDTCCINKTDPTELTEAINSMFQWYKSSDVCIVYLSDVFSTRLPEVSNPEFEKSIWFSRGWTLQELLAPTRVDFYSANWIFISTKTSCLEVLSSITRIVESALQGNNFERFSIAQRMSWASERKTTRVEDTAYCLLGIFDVNMPLLYGEGHKAFVRLQQEIIKTSDDHSILAWEGLSKSQLQSWPSPFAPEPQNFKSGQDIERSTLTSKVNHFSFQRKPYSMTNLGIHITLPIIRAADPIFYAVLDCHKADIPLCVPLLRTTEDQTQYRRARRQIVTVDKLVNYLCEIRSIYIRGSTPPLVSVNEIPASFRNGRWSTQSLEISQIIQYIEGSKPSEEDKMVIYHSLPAELKMCMVYLFVSIVLHFIVILMEWDFMFGVLGTTALFSALTLRGSLALHVRLFVIGGLSSVGFRLETLLTRLQRFWNQYRIESVSEKIANTWTMAEVSRVQRYDIHSPDQLLRDHWMDIGQVETALISIIGLKIFIGPLSSRVWIVAILCLQLFMFRVLVALLVGQLQRRRWPQAGLVSLMVCFYLTIVYICITSRSFIQTEVTYNAPRRQEVRLQLGY